MNRKVQAARFSILSNLVLVVSKLGVGGATGSVSIISEAIHSAVDLVAASIALLSIRAASRPADREHNFGHGKIENLSALVEGILVLVAGAWIIYESVVQLLERHVAEESNLSLLVMGGSALLNYLVSGYLFLVAREEESAALEADAWHLRTDVWTSVVVFVGLLVVRLTQVFWIDAVLAMLVAVMILKAGWDLCRESLTPLIDTRLAPEEEAEIVGLIEQHQMAYVEFHDLRTRRAGAERHIDFHLVVHGRRTLAEVHHLCDRIEAMICRRFPTAHVLIHPEPCPSGCTACATAASMRDSST